MWIALSLYYTTLIILTTTLTKYKRKEKHYTHEKQTNLRQHLRELIRTRMSDPEQELIKALIQEHDDLEDNQLRAIAAFALAHIGKPDIRINGFKGILTLISQYKPELQSLKVEERRRESSGIDEPLGS